MLTMQACGHFKTFAALHDHDLTSVDAQAAVELIIGWFEGERAEDVAPPTPETARLGVGSHWCFDPADVSSLRQAIALSPATGYVSARPPGKVRLDFRNAD